MKRRLFIKLISILPTLFLIKPKRKPYVEINNKLFFIEDSTKKNRSLDAHFSKERELCNGGFFPITSVLNKVHPIILPIPNNGHIYDFSCNHDNAYAYAGCMAKQ